MVNGALCAAVRSSDLDYQTGWKCGSGDRRPSVVEYAALRRNHVLASGSKSARFPEFHALTHSLRRESDHTRRVPLSFVGGSTSNAVPATPHSPACSIPKADIGWRVAGTRCSVQSSPNRSDIIPRRSIPSAVIRTKRLSPDRFRTNALYSIFNWRSFVRSRARSWEFIANTPFDFRPGATSSA